MIVNEYGIVTVPVVGQTGCGGAAVTVTDCRPSFVVSALEVAVIVSLDAAGVAVYTPACVIVPRLALQVTE